MIFKRRSVPSNSSVRRSDDVTNDSARLANSGDSANLVTSSTSTTDTGLSALVEACRRISAERQVADIQRLAVREAIALTSAEVGAFLACESGDDAGNRFAFLSHPQLFAASEVSGPAFLNAVNERTALCDVLVDEPGIAISPVAVAAVPAIASGRMIGMIVVVRSADEPFGNTELETLNLLAPVAGSALANAEPANQDEIDSLTRLANRRRMDRDFIDLSRDGQVGIASIQVDRFASLVQHHGTAATDELLRQIALTVTGNIRPSDVAYRSGDAEFVILLPQTEKKEAAWVAERVRQAITAVTIHGLTQSEHATASIGVTAGDHDDPQELAERARSAMFEAEELGCNRVVLDGAV